MAYFSTLLLSMFITIGLVPILIRAAVRFQAMDVPDERKVHTVPVPRVGGLAMAAGALLPVFFQNHLDPFSASVFLGAAVIVVFGVLDDFFGLEYRHKFAGQVAASLLVILLGGLRISSLGALLPDHFGLPSWLGIPLTLLAVVGVTNAVNLADGLDGLAGGIMLPVFICLGFLGHGFDNWLVSLVSIAMVGAIFGFLRFNTHPATIFMGDTGSQLIGFLAATMALSITQGNDILSPTLTLLLLGLPLLDTAVVMGERIARGKSPFRPDKNHLHHKLMRMGLYHTEAVFVIYAIQSALVVSAYLLRFHSDWLLLAVFGSLVSMVLVPIYRYHDTGFRFQRNGRADKIIKNRLRRLVKGNSLVIRTAMTALEHGIPLLSLLAVVVPERIPVYLAVMGGGALAALCLAVFVHEKWIGSLVRLVVYFLLPQVLLQIDRQVSPWIGPMEFHGYLTCYAVIAFATVMVLKFTRRTRGFKPTPTDFLIVFTALVVPNLPDPAIQGFGLGFLATCLIVFFFGVEVLAGELRGKERRLGICMLPAMGILTLRGFF